MTHTLTENAKFVDTKVTYHIEVAGSLIVVENVPARVDIETGEELFSPRTVERLQEMIREPSQAARFIQTPVYTYD